MENENPKEVKLDVDIPLALSEQDYDRKWSLCCSKSHVASVKYFTTVTLCFAVIGFSIIQLAIYPPDLEIRANYLPLLSGTLMLFINPPSH